jgi:hypothetical protein
MKLYAVPFLICILMLFPTQAHNSPTLIELRSVTYFGSEPQDQGCISLDPDDDKPLLSQTGDLDRLTALIMCVAKACSPSAWLYPPHR